MALFIADKKAELTWVEDRVRDGHRVHTTSLPMIDEVLANARVLGEGLTGF